MVSKQNQPANGSNNGNPNPFRTGNSPFGSRQSGNSNNLPKRPPLPGRPPQPSSRPSPFSGGPNRLGSRFSGAAQMLTWTRKPFASTAVLFQLTGLGDPFYRLLGMKLDLKNRTPDFIAETLQKDDDLRGKLIAMLDESWASYNLRGAILLHPNKAEVKRAYAEIPYPQPPSPAKQDSDDDDDDFTDDDDKPSTKADNACYRAIDMGLVLNVLGRTRGNVLAGDTPLALEVGFLRAAFISDDPRLVEIAQATGCIEESWS